MSSFAEIVEKATNSFVGWVVVSAAAFVIWCVRRIFTNQQMIEMQRQELKAMAESLAEIRAELHEVRTDIKMLYQR